MIFRTTHCDIETSRKWILLFVCLSVALGEVACGGSSGSGSGSSSTPSVSLSTKPPASLAAGASTNIVAAITSDPKNLGITWSCTPGNSQATCGLFKPTDTEQTEYTAPPIAATVTVTATSVADTTISASAQITITASAPTIAFSSAPPAGAFTGTTTNLAATTTGDTTNQGVTWSCAPVATCGILTSQSGTTATYVAPATAGAITITAALTSFPNISVSAPVNVVAQLSGYYVFSLSGTSKNPNAPSTLQPYSVAGVFYVTDGNIKNGEQDSFTTGATTPDSINAIGSSYGLTADGHLLIQLQVGDPSVGVNGLETFDGAFLPLNPNRALLTEFDSSVAASGTLDSHPNSSFLVPTGGYVFELNGLSNLTGYSGAMSMAGVINVDNVGGPGAISGNGSIFDACIAGSGNHYQAQTFSSVANGNYVSAPDSFGRVNFVLSPGGTSFDFFPAQMTLAGYIVDSTHIRLVEIGDAFGGILGGTAFGQGASTGTFSSTNVSGQSYVLGLTGADSRGAAQLAGVFVFNSDGTVTGFADYNDLTPPAQGPNPITDAIYTVDGPTSLQPDAGTGRVTLTGMTSAFNVGPNTIDWLELYLDGSGHAVATVLNGVGNAIGGLGYQQSQTTPFTTASLSGAYGIDASGWDHGGSELDAVGAVTATASSATFTGSADLNWLLSANPTATNLPLSGTISATGGAAANGVFTGTMTGLDVATPANKDQFSFYLIDSNGGAIAIETDVNQLTLVSLFQQ